MHSLEAIIALFFLISFFGIAIGLISFYNEEFIFYKEKYESLTYSNYCSTLIDYFYIESISKIEVDNCFGEDNVVFKDNLMYSYTIAKIKKENNLLVEKNEHYIK